MVTVKICGLTGIEDAAAAADAGADFLGFVFFAESRRCVPLDELGWIHDLGRVPKVGVFRNQPLELVERVREAAGLDYVQLHGDEPPEVCAALGGRGRVIKAVSVGDRIDWSLVAEWSRVARILFDTASASGGGTGRSFDWGLLVGRPVGIPFWLAGGLRPENVAAAVAAVEPAGVDVASGVELSVGVKDPARMRAFVSAVRSLGSSRSGPGAERGN